jgi:hypothetical protein
LFFSRKFEQEILGEPISVSSHLPFELFHIHAIQRRQIHIQHYSMPSNGTNRLLYSISWDHAIHVVLITNKLHSDSAFALRMQIAMLTNGCIMPS